MNFAMKTEILYPFVLVLSLTRLQVAARGVNISSVWFLPEEGFPVFYRYFNDKVTWNEAEAVCGHHHTDLLTVQTSAQMDAARAYLKEIDVTDNVWIGLHRESPEKQFSWTNGEKLVGDGYWLEPIPRTNEKLCGALDPTSDFRWNTYYCGGPQVASFVCELPVPEWAKKEDGCMITSLPSLTVTYIPEMEIVQLFSDCGLDGTRRIACKGGVNREEIVKRLSCDEDVSTMFSKSTTDTVKDVITLQSAWSNDLKGAQQDGTKSWATRLPQTRHKRMANPPGDTQSEQPNNSTQTETLTQTVMSTEKATVLNVPSRNFPHSPAGRDVPSTISPAASNGTSTPSETDNTTASSPKADKPVISSPSNTSSVAALPPTLIAKLKTPIEEAKSKFAGGSTQSPVIKANLTENTNRPVQGIGKEVPVSVISNETSNDSLPSNATTSENPPIVFMVDDKEGMSEPYLLPMGRDVIVNNPSLSPMEVIDVDLIELENLTTTTATPPPPTEPAATPSPITTILTSTPTTPPQKSIMGIHPLRLGEKNAVGENTSTSVATTTGTTSTSTTTTTTTTNPPVSTSTTLSQTENLQQISQNNLEIDNDGEDLDMPQRPSRGRLITRSNIPSFYPYFFNKVLG